MTNRDFISGTVPSQFPNYLRFTIDINLNKCKDLKKFYEKANTGPIGNRQATANMYKKIAYLLNKKADWFIRPNWYSTPGAEIVQDNI